MNSNDLDSLKYPPTNENSFEDGWLEDEISFEKVFCLAFGDMLIFKGVALICFDHWSR